MPLTVIANHVQVVSAINRFNAEYHDDYLRVKRLATQYLVAPTAANTAPLAHELRVVLYRWGAGRRGAPTVQPLLDLQATLLNPNTHALLVDFAGSPITMLSIDGADSRVIDGVSTAATLLAFDTNLTDVLLRLSIGIFVGNTNVTYPMKALLLLTGFMPALDSQVRKGLGSAGFAGTNVTQFLLPVGINSKEAAKLTRLPFYLGECYTASAALLTAAAAASQYPWLGAEPGRLLDVLLFMQGASAQPQPLVALTPQNLHWHRLL